MSSGLRAERLFAAMCSEQFLRGFVFHSPKFFNPTEKEAGDVVLWVRREVVVFEIISRAPSSSGTRQFVKRIGEKRDQLSRDYEAFRHPEITIRLINEDGEEVIFDKENLDEFGFSGVVIIDCGDALEPLHRGTIGRSLELPFPTAVMTLHDFFDLMREVDTVPDLTYYLQDRFAFLQQVFATCPSYFLNLSNHLEGNLIAFYKMNHNAFPVSRWEPNDAFGYREKYVSSMGKLIELRNAQNKESFVIDEIIDLLRSKNHPADSTLIHSFELASMTRRQRAMYLSKKIIDGYDKMIAGRAKRHFAFFNQATGCWLVFYFRFGGAREEFVDELHQLLRYKMAVEVIEREFKYSVFGYGFRACSSQAGVSDILLRIADAESFTLASSDEYSTGRELFGYTQYKRIVEFPHDEPLARTIGMSRGYLRYLVAPAARFLAWLKIKRPR